MRGRNEWHDQWHLPLLRVRQPQVNGHDACEGTTVREDKVLHSIANHLDAEFLSLDGPNDGTNLAWKADREELKPGDLPKAFARL